MRMKKVASPLICAVMLLTVAPSKAFAQTLPAQPAGIGQGAGDAQAKPKPGLRTALAGVMAKSRADAVTEADIKRLESERLNPRTYAKPQAGYTKKEKILVFSIVAGLVVLAVVLALTTEKGGHTFCDIDPADPDCIGAR